jgi:hypothetical protein
VLHSGGYALNQAVEQKLSCCVLGEVPLETLEFDYNTTQYHSGDKLQLSYALTPVRDIPDARDLAHSTAEIAETVNTQQIQSYVTPILLATFLVIFTIIVLLKMRSSFSKEKNPRNTRLTPKLYEKSP